MNASQWLWIRACPLLFSLSLVACSASDDGGSQASQRAMSVKVSQDGKCTEPGMHACFCSDGQSSGTQVCGSDGSLSACSCPTKASSGGGGSTAGTSAPAGEGTPLCSELAGQSGCHAMTYESKKLPASVLFVVDRSGSMNCNLPPLQTNQECEAMAAAKDPSKPTKWAVTTQALKDAFAELQAQNSSVSIGLSFFSNDDMCGVSSKPVVSVAPLTMSNVTTLGAILDGTEPAGGTPVIGATILAYQHLHEEAGASVECPGAGCPCAAPPCGASGNRYVVLITDGAESCASGPEELAKWTSQLLDTDAPRALEANVRTFVVGSPGSEPARGFLSELAFQGGTAKNGGSCKHDRAGADGDCHFDMTTTQDFAGDLANVLTSISGTALSCQFSVPSALDGASSQNVNVQLTREAGGTPECLGRDDSRPCEMGADGWQFAKQPDGTDDLSKVVVCGPSCNLIKSSPAARVDVLLGCQSILVE